MTWPLVPTNGETARTEGHSSAMARASAAVSVVTVPWRTPAVWLLAGKTMMTLEPMVWNSVCTSWPAPCPTDTIVVTAEMPMTTPSTVSRERSLFLASVRREMASKSKSSTGSPRREGAFRSGHEGVALGDFAVHQFRELVFDQAEGHGDGAEQRPVLDPDDAVLAVSGPFGPFPRPGRRVSPRPGGRPPPPPPNTPPPPHPLPPP